MVLSLLVIALALTGLHLSVLLIVWARTRRLLAFHQIVLGAAVGACAQVVLTAYALSLARALVPTIWLGVNLLLCLTWVALASRTGIAWPELRRALAERLALLRQLRRRPALLAVLAMSALGIGVLLAKVWIYPPYGYDGLEAHLTTARMMLQDHGMPAQLAPRPRATFSPKVPHIFFAAALAAPEGYMWGHGANIYFLLLAFLAQYAFARRLGARRSVALFVSPAVLFCPVFFQQAATAYIDLPTAAFIAVTLPFLPSRRESALLETAFASAGLGMALGSKESMVPMVPLLGFVIAAQAWRLRSGTALGRLLAPALILAVLAVLLGGFTYISNSVRYGNPVYAMQFKILGHQLPGVSLSLASAGVFYNHPLTDAYRYASPLRQIWMSWREERQLTVPFVYQADTTIGGFGPQWFVLFLPAILVSLVVHRKSPWLSVVAVFAVFVAVLPGMRCLTRYIAFVFFLGPAAYALVAPHLSRIGTVAWQSLFVALLALAFAMNLSFQQDVRGAVLARLLQVDASARTPDPNPAAQFLKDVPPEGSSVGSGREGVMKAFCMWNKDGSDRVWWMLHQSWPTKTSATGYPASLETEALQRFIARRKIDYVVMEPRRSKELAASDDYVLVVPATPSSDSSMQRSSPVAVWMRVRGR